MFWNSPEKILETFFWRTLAPVYLVLGLEHSCPLSREDLSSKGLFLASDFFVSLVLSCVLDSTSAFYATYGPLSLLWSEKKEIVVIIIRDGVLEDVLGLEDTFSSPWPWPRSLKSSKIALSSARGQHYFLNR